MDSEALLVGITDYGIVWTMIWSGSGRLHRSRSIRRLPEKNELDHRRVRNNTECGIQCVLLF